MSSIVLFNSTFTMEKDIREKFAAASGFVIIQDNDVIDKTSIRYNLKKRQGYANSL